MQVDEEKKYLEHRAFQEVSNYFADKFINQWKQNKVVVLVDDIYTSLYYLPCNEFGFPTYNEFKSIIIDPLSIEAINDCYVTSPVNIKIEELIVSVRSPMLTYRHPGWNSSYYPKQYVYMWSGRIMSKSKVPIEKLNVNYLMKQ